MTPIVFVTKRVKRLCEVMGGDIPRGLSAEDVAFEECVEGRCVCPQRKANRRRYRRLPSTQHLIRLIRKYFGQLKSVEAVFIAKDRGIMRVWTVIEGPSGKHYLRSLRAVQTREEKIREYCKDLRLVFQKYRGPWQHLRYVSTPTGLDTIWAYQRRRV